MQGLSVNLALHGNTLGVPFKTDLLGLSFADQRKGSNGIVGKLGLSPLLVALVGRIEVLWRFPIARLRLGGGA